MYDDDMNFPMPNDRLDTPLGPVTVVASIHLNDDDEYQTALTICLLPESPFFLICVWDIRDGIEYDYTVHRVYNIVEAVREYENNGGDW